MTSLTEKASDPMLFPRPADGAVVEISPPGLAARGGRGWVPRGDPVYEQEIGNDPVHLADQVLEAGDDGEGLLDGR